jgi:hypothetical protein
MLTGKYRRIYHYHLQKCGGSTLNHWLDTLTSDERVFNRLRGAVPGTGIELEDGQPDLRSQQSRALFHWSDVVYEHRALRMYVPENTFCFTVLRDPVQRLVSQVADWRRLNDSDTISSSPRMLACIRDCQRLPLRDFLEKHGQQGGRTFVDNYLTRALAAGRVGDLVDDVVDADRLREVALQSLEKDYDLIGLTEEMDLSRNALCSMVGLPPAREIPTLNKTQKIDNGEFGSADLRDIVKKLTRVDRIIYDKARELFDRRHRLAAEAYDTAAFEVRHASRLLGEARGLDCGGAIRYSVQSPIVGSGFHGRDGSGLASCAVWSGPETRTTLYMPTPANMPLSLLVWIRGYIASGQRGQLRVHVDGQPVPHYFGVADDYADVLMIDTHSTRDFIRLEIDLDETLESGEPGTEFHDTRRRGFAFDSYGWRPL